MHIIDHDLNDEQLLKLLKNVNWPCRKKYIG